MNELKTIDRTDKELRVANYMILFGGKDLAGEFFTDRTEMKSAYTESGVLHVDFEHGLDPDRIGMKSDDVMGYVDWKSARVDETGIFVERVLNRQAAYMSYIEDLIEMKRIGTSSQCVPRTSERKPTGEITRWPLMRDTLTLTPCEPRMLQGNAIEKIKELKTFFPDSKSIARAICSEINLDEIKTIRQAEAWLRESVGFSKSMATAFVSHVTKLGEPASDEIKALKRELYQLRMSSLVDTLNRIGK